MVLNDKFNNDWQSLFFFKDIYSLSTVIGKFLCETEQHTYKIHNCSRMIDEIQGQL